MSKFEFSIAIVSVVLALATTELITSWGRLIKKSERLNIDLLYASWSLFVLVGAVVHWGGLWAYESAPFDSQIELFVILLPALTIALAVSIFSPDGELALSQREQYLRASPRFFPLIGMAYFLAAIADYIVVGSSMNLLYVIAASLLVSAIGWTQSVRLHVIVLSICWCLAILTVFGGVKQWYNANVLT